MTVSHTRPSTKVDQPHSVPFVKCQCCGEWHTVDVVRDTPPIEMIIQANQLSPVACTILQNKGHLPPAFLRGEPVSLRILSGVVGFSYEHVRSGLRELAELGLIQAVSFGSAGRKRYVGAAGLARARLAV